MSNFAGSDRAEPGQQWTFPLVWGFYKITFSIKTRLWRPKPILCAGPKFAVNNVWSDINKLMWRHTLRLIWRVTFPLSTFCKFEHKLRRLCWIWLCKSLIPFGEKSTISALSVDFSQRWVNRLKRLVDDQSRSSLSGVCTPKSAHLTKRQRAKSPHCIGHCVRNSSSAKGCCRSAL